MTTCILSKALTLPRAICLDLGSCQFGGQRQNLNIVSSYGLSRANQFVASVLVACPICKLCGQEPENIDHLFKDFVFTKDVLNLLLPWFNLNALHGVDCQGWLYKWWGNIRLKVVKHECRGSDGLTIYVWWKIWKERNRKTFQNLEK